MTLPSSTTYPLAAIGLFDTAAIPLLSCYMPDVVFVHNGFFILKFGQNIAESRKGKKK
jgi:hypothetical protein